MTIVNVMGNVLRFYLGADLPREPDDMYLSVDRAPFAFKQVDFAWLAREDWSGRPGTTRPGSLTTLCRGFRTKMFRSVGGVAQLVEQGTFNP